jgi:hypothetical protein
VRWVLRGVGGSALFATVFLNIITQQSKKQVLNLIQLRFLFDSPIIASSHYKKYLKLIPIDFLAIYLFILHYKKYLKLIPIDFLAIYLFIFFESLTNFVEKYRFRKISNFPKPMWQLNSLIINAKTGFEKFSIFKTHISTKFVRDPIFFLFGKTLFLN